ncbi:MAG: GSCFA domain-containing protein [Desulforhopalus sp.]
MKFSIIGMSHINCMSNAAKNRKNTGSDFSFLQLRDEKFLKKGVERKITTYSDCNGDIISYELAKISNSVDFCVLCLTGNEHVFITLVNNGDLSKASVERRVDIKLNNYRTWLRNITKHIGIPVAVIPPTPPFESTTSLIEKSGRFAQKIDEFGVSPAEVRLFGWQCQCDGIRKACAEEGVTYIELPGEIFSENGFLKEEYIGRDPFHANEAYGLALLDYFEANSSGGEGNITFGGRVLLPPGDMQKKAASEETSTKKHPYVGLPDRNYWKKGVTQVPQTEFDPVGVVPFKISSQDNVATAGSCFAQHISKRIRAGGFRFLVTETKEEFSEEEAAKKGFYDFSARYGNIYTSRQLTQLFDRAFGYFVPIEESWELPDSRYCDPFRPRIEPGGYASIEELRRDKVQHLSAVKKMFETLDIFVFTLGLTECWVSRLDGAAYPLAPGVAGGNYSDEKHEFINFGVEETVSDLESFLQKLRLINPGSRVILTVSPVPLAATFEPRHVLVSTTYSKSVLRVAAESVSRRFDNVLYFPSYEIITGNYNRGTYFGKDLRSITQEGVDHVMSIFMGRMTQNGNVHSDAVPVSQPDFEREMEELAEAECDEELLEND